MEEKEMFVEPVVDVVVLGEDVICNSPGGCGQTDECTEPNMMVEMQID